jgi:hypothetical protein
MGEIADEHIDRMLGDGEYPFRLPRVVNKWSANCRRCGASGLKWRPEETGWVLFENERVEHNRLKKHECNPISDEGFGVVE